MSNSITKAGKTEVILARQAALERLQELDESIRYESYNLLNSVLAFSEIDQKATEVPREWVKEFGPLEAQRRFRLAKAGWMGAKDAPVAIKVAASIVGNAIKAKAVDENRPLNLTLVKITGTLPKYEEVEIDK